MDLLKAKTLTTFSKIKHQQQCYQDCSLQSSETLNELINANLELLYLPHCSWGVFKDDVHIKEKVDFFLEQKVEGLHRSVEATLKEAVSNHCVFNVHQRIKVQ